MLGCVEGSPSVKAPCRGWADGQRVGRQSRSRVCCTGAGVVLGLLTANVEPTLVLCYVPNNPSFACDAITVPAGNSSNPIVLWETSVTSPHDPDRIKKVCKWFRTDNTRSKDGKSDLPPGIVTALRAAYPGRPIVCALCWPESLRDAGNKSAYKELMECATTASSRGAEVRVVVIDRAGLQHLGVLV